MAPSRQVHWYLQLLWNVSPLLYTVPPNTQVAPSRAVEGERKAQDSVFTEATRRSRWIRWQQLTRADAYPPVDAGPEVAVEALVRVAHVSLCAQLPHLFGAHPAAAAAVKDQADSWGALGGSGGARALFAALLSRSLSPTQGHGVR